MTIRSYEERYIMDHLTESLMKVDIESTKFTNQREYKEKKKEVVNTYTTITNHMNRGIHDQWFVETDETKRYSRKFPFADGKVTLLIEITLEMKLLNDLHSDLMEGRPVLPF